MAKKKEYQIKVLGQLVSVNKDVYLTYHRMKRREKYLEERDTVNGVSYYSALDTVGTRGEDTIPDLASPGLEDIVVAKIMIQRLYQCLAQLTNEEQELIFILFFENKNPYSKTSKQSSEMRNHHHVFF
jgi:hypothetical protein